jgi:hypothetical protein
MRRVGLLFVALLVAVSACSGGLSLADYAEQLEVLVSSMNARLDSLDADPQGTADLEAVRFYAIERVEARSVFLTDLRALEPPDEVAELHETAVGIIERLVAAESALADRVMTMSSADDIGSIWDTPEGVAARAADGKAVELCLAAQSEFDETADRADLKDVPWIPAEMKEVILVAFGCLQDQR